ncbi:YidB family protein [Embleya sp. NPDC050493]|uniref:YidB family protein n=1 Tax=Embleya sp. NPDC050493 TaxID=3363989 RepID=UPI0037BA5430
MTDPAMFHTDSAPAPTTLSISAQDLADAGLEPQLRSWIGTGANEPVTAGQITDLVGEDELARAAASVGRAPGDLAAGLAVDLPRLVDAASPDGRIEPDHDRDEVDFSTTMTARLVVAASRPVSDQVGNHAANFTVIFDAVPRA